MTVSDLKFRIQNHTDFWQEMIRFRGKIYIFLNDMLARLGKFLFSTADFMIQIFESVHFYKEIYLSNFVSVMLKLHN